MASSSCALEKVFSSSTRFFFKLHNPDPRSVSLFSSGVARRSFNNVVRFPESAMAASSLSLKRVYSSSSLFFKIINPAVRSISRIPSGAPRCGSFNNSAPLNNDDDRPIFRFPGSTVTDCSESVEEELIVTSRGLVAIKEEEGYELRQDFENLYLKKELPGYGKEDVEISMEGDILTVKGEVVKESGNDEFIFKLNICSSLFRHDKIESHLKNGVLEMVFPKVNHTPGMKNFKLENAEKIEWLSGRKIREKSMFETFKAVPQGEVVYGSKSGSGWAVREDGEAVCITFELPGMGKDDVKITLKRNSLAIQGSGSEGGFSGGMDNIPPYYDLHSITAHITDGVLKVILPKAKDGDRSSVTTSSDDVKHITVY